MPPLNNSSQSVQRMFDRIARRYDLLNRVISFRLDVVWRKRAIDAVARGGGDLILDLGTGTGDLALAAARRTHARSQIVGLDLSFEMLKLAQKKKSQSVRATNVSFVQGSALAPPFGDGVFDGVMTAFVLRNVADLGLFFAHALRVLKPGGRLVSLDMFPPSGSFFAVLYPLYFYRVVPWIGSVLARDRKAYQYLSKSVRHFHPPEAISAMIERAGFEQVKSRRFLSGAVCLHEARKPRATPLL